MIFLDEIIQDLEETSKQNVENPLGTCKSITYEALRRFSTYIKGILISVRFYLISDFPSLFSFLFLIFSKSRKSVLTKLNSKKNILTL